MLFCDGCDRGFHLKCCHPPLVDVPDGKHMFYNCQSISHQILLIIGD